MKNRARLTTEKRNRKTKNIDKYSTIGIVDIINSQDMLVAPAVAKEKKCIASAVDTIVKSFKQGGRLFYVGAGTSGRLGVLDAAECPPTYGVKPTLVQGIIAGGRQALVRSVEGAEDSAENGAKALIKKRLKPVDAVVGIAACGITPFVQGAMKKAKQLGAATIFITCAPQAKKYIPADIIINPIVGPEVITGSTRMKAGTATKLVLNTLTTAAMIKIGKVYGNLMVDLKATNFKLRDRSERIITEMTKLSRPAARKLLKKADGLVKAAVVMHFKKVNLKKALNILKECDESLRAAIGR
jgi:N-acetylmuramic acid 6-phosphate etherase